MPPLSTTDLLLLFAASGALIGALATPLVFWGKGRKPSSGFFVGVVAGGLGNLVLLLPLWFLLRPRQQMNLPLFNLAVAYRLGEAAVSGGRREEARYYFTQVTQADPRNVAAWLHLTSLASSPMEEWGYVQQARAVEPNNAMVQEVANQVWAKVARLYQEQADTKP
jgi:hypothetical protein